MNSKDYKINNLKSNSDFEFLEDYWSRYKEILFESRNDKLILKLRDYILKTHNKGGKLIFIGNGASASLASHAATDFTKQAKIRAIAFNDHNLITAFSNDYGYDQWIAKALKFYANENDRCIFISVSGSSPNLINGLKYAKSKSIDTASLTGSRKDNFLRMQSDCSLWVNSNAYNIVESIHTIWLTLIIDLFVGDPEYSVS